MNKKKYVAVFVLFSCWIKGAAWLKDSDSNNKTGDLIYAVIDCTANQEKLFFISCDIICHYCKLKTKRVC